MRRASAAREASERIRSKPRCHVDKTSGCRDCTLSQEAEPSSPVRW
ncbi:hypothetical protein ACFFX0_25640 [Citricoccus parietis]|uniref:Uncharacterized protein n=1 Tax=Citricoccus parietis TaxID=592307 RepID=A0ABV5G674_9MICC